MSSTSQTPTSKICPNCKTPLLERENENRFCTFCGFDLKPQPLLQYTPPPQINPPSPSSKPVKKSTFKEKGHTLKKETASTSKRLLRLMGYPIDYDHHPLKTQLEHAKTIMTIKTQALQDGIPNLLYFYYNDLSDLMGDFCLLEEWKAEIEFRMKESRQSLTSILKEIDETWEDWQGQGWQLFPISQDYTQFLVDYSIIQSIIPPKDTTPYYCIIIDPTLLRPEKRIESDIADLLSSTSEAKTQKISPEQLAEFETKTQKIPSEKLAELEAKTEIIPKPRADSYWQISKELKNEELKSLFKEWNQTHLALGNLPKQYPNVIAIAKDCHCFQGLKHEFTYDILEEGLSLEELERQLGCDWNDWQGDQPQIVLNFLPYEQEAYAEWLLENAHGQITSLKPQNAIWIVTQGDKAEKLYTNKYRLWIYPKLPSYTEPMLQGEFDTREGAETYFNTNPNFKAYEAEIQEFPQIVEAGLIYELNDRLMQLRITNQEEIRQNLQNSVRYMRYDPTKRTWVSHGLQFPENQIVINYDDTLLEEWGVAEGFFCQICHKITIHPQNHIEEHLLALKYDIRKKELEQLAPTKKVRCKERLRGGKGQRCTRWGFFPSGYCPQHDPDRPIKPHKKPRRVTPSKNILEPSVMEAHIEEILNNILPEEIDLNEWWTQNDPDIDPDISEEENLLAIYGKIMAKERNIMDRPWEHKASKSKYHKPTKKEIQERYSYIVGAKEKEEEEERIKQLEREREAIENPLVPTFEKSEFEKELEEIERQEKEEEERQKALRESSERPTAITKIDRAILAIKENSVNQVGRFIRQNLQYIKYNVKSKQWERYGLQMERNQLTINPENHVIEHSIFQNVFICERCQRFVANPKHHAEDHLIQFEYLLSVFSPATKVQVKAYAMKMIDENDTMVFLDPKNNILYQVEYRAKNTNLPKQGWNPEAKRKAVTFSIEVTEAEYRENYAEPLSSFNDVLIVKAVPVSKSPFIVTFLETSLNFQPGFSLRYIPPPELIEETQKKTSEYDQLFQWYQDQLIRIKELGNQIQAVQCSPMQNVVSSSFNLKEFDLLINMNQALDNLKTKKNGFNFIGIGSEKALVKAKTELDTELLKQIPQEDTNILKEFAELKTASEDLADRIRKKNKFTTKLEQLIQQIRNQIQYTIKNLMDHFYTILYNLQFREELLHKNFIQTSSVSFVSFEALKKGDYIYYNQSEKRDQSTWRGSKKEYHLNYGKQLERDNWQPIALAPFSFYLISDIAFDENTLTASYEGFKQKIIEKRSNWYRTEFLILQVTGRSEFTVKTILIGDKLEPSSPAKEIQLKQSENFDFGKACLLYPASF